MLINRQMLKTAYCYLDNKVYYCLCEKKEITK